MPQNPIAFLTRNAKTGSIASGAVGQQSELFVGQRHGAHYEAAYAGRTFMGMNPTGSPVTTSAALATTYVGLCLSNPAASGKSLVVVNVSAALQVAPSTITTMGLIWGYAAGGVTVHTTPLTPVCSFINGTAGVGLLDSACTLVGTPAWARVLGQAPTATTSFAISANIDGSIVIPPGGYVAIGTNIAGPTSGFVGSMLWEEVAP